MERFENARNFPTVFKKWISIARKQTLPMKVHSTRICYLQNCINDTNGFVKDTETEEDLSGRSTPNERGDAKNEKMI